MELVRITAINASIPIRVLPHYSTVSPLVVQRHSNRLFVVLAQSVARTPAMQQASSLSWHQGQSSDPGLDHTSPFAVGYWFCLPL